MGNGTGQPKQPPQAPPTSNDRATEADRRLADLNSGSGGINPNQQLGSSTYDDMRNMRMPIGNILPALDPSGGVSVMDGLAYSPDAPIFTWAQIRGMERSRGGWKFSNRNGRPREAGGQSESWRKYKEASDAANAPASAPVIDREGNVSSAGGGGRASGTAANRGMGGPAADDRSFYAQYWGGVWNDLVNGAVSVGQDIYNAYVGAATAVQGVIDTAGGYWFGDVSWQGFKGSVKDLWGNPVVQGGLDVLAAFTMFTPIPFDDVLWMSRAGRMGIYYGIKNGKIVYFGRSGSIIDRLKYWAMKGRFSRTRAIPGLQDLTYWQVRAIEDFLIRTTRDGPEYIGKRYLGGKLWNKRYEIDSRHPYHRELFEWARRELERRGVVLPEHLL